MKGSPDYSRNISLDNVGEPAVVIECPDCSGEIAVFLTHYEEYNICSLEGAVHIQPDEEEDT